LVLTLMQIASPGARIDCVARSVLIVDDHADNADTSEQSDFETDPTTAADISVICLASPSESLAVAAIDALAQQLATPVPVPKVYSTVTARAWALIVKAPDNYAGKGYQIWAA